MTSRKIFTTKTGSVIFVDSIVLIEPVYNSFTYKTDYNVHLKGGFIKTISEDDNKFISIMYTSI